MACEAGNIKKHKKNDLKVRKALNNLKPGWVAPDGGWGWVIVAAAGFANIFITSFNLCFGLVFRERLQQYGISTSQTTTLINAFAAVSSFVGLTNGPLFKRFTFRQAACAGAFVCSAAICMMAFAKTFYGMLVLYSILYAGGWSVVMSASTLSLIQYFTTKRRTAVGLSWVLSGLGNIIGPQVVTLLMSVYGAFGTIILFGGIGLHSIICAILIQPIQIHAKRCTEYKNIETIAKEYDETSAGAVINGSSIILPINNVQNENGYLDRIEKLPCQRFGDRYLQNDNEDYELEAPQIICTEENRQCSNSDSSNRNRTMDMNEETLVQLTNSPVNSDDIKNHGNEIVVEKDDKMGSQIEKRSTVTYREVEDDQQSRTPWWINVFHTVVTFFDLDLLRNFACVNIMFSISLLLIIEINFIILTPYILADYGLTDSQIAVIMSIAGGVDVLTRLIISVVTSRIRWENRTFMSIGVGISAIGHAALAHANSYHVILGVIIISAIGKGICLIMSTLVLPDYVSFKKLAAATGLEKMIGGILFFAFGPIIGRLREMSGSYTIPLHVLNIFAYYIIISGIIERWCYSSRRNRQKQMKEACV